MGNTRKYESTCRYVHVVGENMKIKLQETEIDTADDTIVWDPLLQQAVNHVKANPSSFTEGQKFNDIQEILDQ